MEIEIIEISQISGDKCHIYSVIVDDDKEDLYTSFVKENFLAHRIVIIDMINRLKVIGRERGAIPSFFKDDEGIPGDGIMAFYDIPDSNLRLYCINYGRQMIILGSGGVKPKSIRTYQEDEKLYGCVKQLQRIEKIIREAIKDKDIILLANGDINGTTKLTDYEDD